MTTAQRYQLPKDSATHTPHTGERNWRTANENLILLTEVGSGLHGVTMGTDDQDMQGVCIEPPSVMLGVNKFDLYEYRTQPQGERSGSGDIDLCHAPGSLVLTADLRWQEIDSLSIGDRVISFDESSSTRDRHRHFSTGTITDLRRLAMPRYRVITSQGETVVSGEHPFLTRHDNNPRTRWTKAEHLQTSQLIYSVPTWREDRSWAGGYLAGQYDGEACLSIVDQYRHDRTAPRQSTVSNLTWIQKAQSPDVPYVESLLAERGYKTFRHFHTGGCAVVRIGDNWFEQARFLGSVRPRRLLRHPSLERLWEGRSLQVCGRAEVLAVEPLGIGEVIAMSVDTRTYIADGLLTHNSVYGMAKWVRLIIAGNPSHLLPLFAPEQFTYAIEWPGQELRENRHLFLAREHAARFLGYLNRQRERMLGQRSQRTNRPELVEKYGYDTKFAYHCLRIAIQGIQLMQLGEIVVPMRSEQRKYLTDVRLGKYTQSEVLKKLGNLESDLMLASKYSSPLPERVDTDYVNDWLTDVYTRYWREKGLVP